MSISFCPMIDSFYNFLSKDFSTERQKSLKMGLICSLFEFDYSRIFSDTSSYGVSYSKC